jgi:hypothetical protein
VSADRLVVLWEIFPDALGRARGLAITCAVDGGSAFAEPEIVPGSDDPALGWSGNLQGRLMRKLAVHGDHVAVAHSTFLPNQRSHVWLYRGVLECGGQRGDERLGAYGPIR